MSESADRTALDTLVAPPAHRAANDGPTDLYSDAAFGAGSLAIVEAAHLPARTQAVREGDVLVSRPTVRARRAWIVAASPREKAATLDRLILRSDEFDPRYLRQLLVSNEFHLHVRRAVSERFAARARMTSVVLARIGIPRPYTDAQARIASVIDEADTLRAKRAPTFLHLDALGYAIFENMFSRTAPQVREWPLLPLTSLCVVPPGTGIAKVTTAPGQWLVVQADAVLCGQLQVLDRKYVDLDRASAARFSIEDGDVLLTQSGAWPAELGRAAIANPGPALRAHHARLFKLRLDPDQVLPEYACYWLASGESRQSIGGIARRTGGRFSISARRLAALRMRVPPLDLQHAFVQQLVGRDQLRERAAASTRALDELLSVLRDRAFRGELTVS